MKCALRPHAKDMRTEILAPSVVASAILSNDELLHTTKNQYSKDITAPVPRRGCDLCRVSGRR